MNLTPFGKELRKIRIEYDITTKQMAEGLGWTTSFLSAVELGHKQIPKDFWDRISAAVNLLDKDKDVLRKAILDSTNQVVIDLVDASPERRRLAVLFAERLPEMDNSLVTVLMKNIEQSQVKR